MDNFNTRISIEQATGQFLNGKNTILKNENQVSFQQILQQKKDETQASRSGASNGLKFSKHADERLSQRSIVLTEEQMLRLEDGATRAEAKGIKESLVLMDNIAFIVNTRNRTVITAMDQTTNDENVYTNIDGAVII